MPGRSNADNKFGPTPFVVGEFLGDGCNYTNIQAAMNDAFAAGGGLVYIRYKTTPYVENLTILPNVTLHGVSIDGRIAPICVVIQGNHTATFIGTGTAFAAFENITFNSVTGDVITLSAGVGDFAVLAMKYCRIDSPDARGVVCVVRASFLCAECNVIGFTQALDVGAGCGYNCSYGRLTSGSTEALRVVGGSGEVVYSLISGVTQAVTMTGGTITLQYNSISASGATISFLAAGVVQSEHNVHSSGNGTGFYIDGIGTYSYSAEVASGTATSIDPATSQTIEFLRPVCDSGVAPGTGVARGTSAFDSAQFTLTDGFVQITNPQISFITGDQGGTLSPIVGNFNLIGGAGVTTTGTSNILTFHAPLFTNQGASISVLTNSGSFATAAITLTLPAGPVIGDECIFVVNTAAVLVIKAAGGQTIQLDTTISAVAGTATSTAQGDIISLRYSNFDTRWYAVSSKGTWVVV